MTAVAEPSGLTQSIGDSTRPILPASQIEELARRTWQWMVQNAGTSFKYQGKAGFKYTGTAQRAMGQAIGQQRSKLDLASREVLDNTIRQFLRRSHNAVCTNKQRGQVEWWVAATWTPSTAVTTYASTDKRQPNWYESRVTEKEATGGYEPFPVSTRQSEPKLPAEPTIQPFPVDERWAQEIIRMMVSEDSVMTKVVKMASEWDGPFTTRDYAELYSASDTTAPPHLTTLLDAQLLEVDASKRDFWRWTATAPQKLALEKLLARKGTGSESRNSFDTNDRVLAALSLTRSQSTSELASKLFMSRTRLINALSELGRKDLVERTRGGEGQGREARWRRVDPERQKEEIVTQTPAVPRTNGVARAAPPTSSPTASPKSTFVPSEQSLSPSSTDDVARLVDRIVEDRVRDVQKDLEAQLMAAREEIESLTAERDKLKEWKSRWQSLLKDD